MSQQKVNIFLASQFYFLLLRGVHEKYSLSLERERESIYRTIRYY